MNYLDQTGLEYLWGKIKTYVGTVVEGGVGEIVVNWDDVKGKPSTFTPSTHTHTVSQITDFPTNLVTNVTISGSGNAVTNASFSDNTLTITKGNIEGGGDSNTVTQMTDDTTSIYWTPLLASYSANNNTETNFVRKLKGVEYNFSEGYFVINETASGIDTMALHIGAVTGDMDLGDGLTINNHGISVSPGGADNSVFRTDGTTSQLKTINGQSLFGTGDMRISYTSNDFAYSAGQFELQLQSNNGMGTLRATCPFEYSDLAGTPTFKTINGQSLIGTGNITIESGAGEDYLPLSGGTLTGNVNMTGDNPIFKLTGRDGYSITLQPHGEESDSSITIESLDGSPKVQVISGEGRSKLTGAKLVFSDNFDDVKSTFADRYIEIGDRSSEFIYVSSSGIEKTGGSPTKVFATDGSVVDMNTYLPLSGGTMTGDLNVTGHTVNAQTVDVTYVGALQITITGNSNNDAIDVNNGGVTARAFYESSDISLKENIAPITKEATDAVDCLTFKQFNFKDDKDKTTKYGVVAQEVEAAGLSNLVYANEEGVKSVDYISLLILKIEALEKRITELEAERG